jgi:hypothetical protein
VIFFRQLITVANIVSLLKPAIMQKNIFFLLILLIAFCRPVDAQKNKTLQPPAEQITPAGERGNLFRRFEYNDRLIDQYRGNSIIRKSEYPQAKKIARLSTLQYWEASFLYTGLFVLQRVMLNNRYLIRGNGAVSQNYSFLLGSSAVIIGVPLYILIRGRRNFKRAVAAFNAGL